MGCEELIELLNMPWRENEHLSKCIAAHIKSCSCCRNGHIPLTEALITSDLLNCNQCRLRFPAYYEATRPTYPLVEMADTELIEVALHLSHCANCSEEYEALVLLSELEERDELLDEY